MTSHLVLGYTDAKAYDDLRIKTYGFAPMLLPPDLASTELFHGHDERVPIEGFSWGLRTFYEAVERLPNRTRTWNH